MIDQLVQDFYGRDPIRGEDAWVALVKLQGVKAIETLIPLQGCPGSGSTQTNERLKAVAAALGPAAAPHLGRAIAEGSWGSKTAAAPCFAAFTDSDEIQKPLIAVLEKTGDFDAERLAIEALGYLGASGWAWSLVEYSKRGVWQPANRDDLDYVSKYPFEKLSSYVLEALARFAAHPRWDFQVDSFFDTLTAYIRLREKELPNRGPDSYQLVERHLREFSGPAVDRAIRYWGRDDDERLQRLCMDLLGAVAPPRAARFLLEVATSSSHSESVRRGASIALGELRHPNAAEQLAAALRDPRTDRSCLDWAFSTLYAVPIDWSGLDDFVEAVLHGSQEPGAQLGWSLALRGERIHEGWMVERLDAGDAYLRWTAALSLARLLGPGSRSRLEHRIDDAGDELERCAMAAASLRAGVPGAAEALHEALQEFGSLPVLRRVWTVEILDAFRTQSGFDERAFRLWKGAAGVTPRQLQYFDALVGATEPPAPAPALAVGSGAPGAKTQTAAVAGGSSGPQMAGPKTKVFISYSHRDIEWLRRFQAMLRPLVANEKTSLWDDTRIQPGKWREQIERAMAECNVALFLVSANLLASEFVTQRELPELLGLAGKSQVRVLWTLIDDCLWEESALADYQGENAGEPLTLMSQGEQSRAIKATCLRIRDLLPRLEHRPTLDNASQEGPTTTA